MNIKTLAIFLISLTWLSCNNYEKTRITQGSLINTDAAKTTLSKKSLADSLIRFSFLDEFTKRDDSSKYVLRCQIINGKKVGIIALTDSTIFLFQSRKNKLERTDSIKFESYAFDFETTDLNGDNNDDLIIHSSPDIHGQTTPYVFIFQKDNLLHYRPDLQLHNIRYNSSNKTIESFYVSCAFCLHTKAVYKWSADSLKLLKRAELDMTDGNSITTRIFEIKNGIEKKVLEIKNKEQIYDTAIFKIVNCY